MNKTNEPVRRAARQSLEDELRQLDAAGQLAQDIAGVLEQVEEVADFVLYGQGRELTEYERQVGAGPFLLAPDRPGEGEEWDEHSALEYVLDKVKWLQMAHRINGSAATTTRRMGGRAADPARVKAWLESLRFVYVFDTTQTDGYLCRVPQFLARRIVHRSSRPLDYWVTESGWQST